MVVIDEPDPLIVIYPDGQVGAKLRALGAMSTDPAVEAAPGRSEGLGWGEGPPDRRLRGAPGRFEVVKIQSVKGDNLPPAAA